MIEEAIEGRSRNPHSNSSSAFFIPTPSYLFRRPRIETFELDFNELFKGRAASNLGAFFRYPIPTIIRFVNCPF